jgi:hypothetical protein
MELLYNNNIINEIVTKLFRHRRNDYSELHAGMLSPHAETLAASLELKHEIIPVANRNY